ncbi:ATP-binding cassette domain-containing protein [Candidatus Saccharibacteria bacterium]|nr:ATP-binding cassette domain-containing protein [Candidatus Saccharibacteria bacterium]
MLVLRDISYKVGNKTILNNISLEVSDADFLIITGPNGSGKSTLAKIIMGIIKPTTGRILYNGKDITNLDVTERAKLGISYAFQQPVNIKGLRACDLIEAAVGAPIGDASAGKYLKAVGLNPDEYLDRELDNSLSGGEKKRIEIASVLARNADLTVFDEPEAGIDLWSFSDLLKVLKKQQLKGKTQIVISHQERIINAGNKLIVLENGEING